MKKHILLALTIICTTTLSATSKKKMNDNPLLQKSLLTLGAPDFSKIRASHYVPAAQTAIDQLRATIQEITSNPRPATFQNTIVALSQASAEMEQVMAPFNCVSGADATDEVAEADKIISPMLTAMGNEISFNAELFQRIKYVYDNERQSLQGEDLRLLEETYKGFVRGGALLSDEDKARLETINNEMAQLCLTFRKTLPQSANAAAVWVDTQAELDGLSEADIAQCQKDAQSLGGKAPYCIVILNTTQQPCLSSLSNRETRRRVFMASVNRANGQGNAAYDTRSIVSQIVSLRAEKAQLLGFNTWADYRLDVTMAGKPSEALRLLQSLVKEYQPAIQKETTEIEQFAQQTEGPNFRLQPWDRAYFDAKMKAQKFQFSDDDVKQYFNIDSVLQNGVFYAAERVYGLTFVERTDLPTYHPDMHVFEVHDSNGKLLALFYCDYFRRPTKRGGAWMSSFQKQSRQMGTLPIIYNVCNFAKAPEGQPSLITWDDVTTMFHEFGHALHGMLSDCQYWDLSGTAVPRDFVEMPSQFNESFAYIPEVFAHFAKHFRTGEPMPDALREKMLSSTNYHTAYALGENLAASCYDMMWHMLTPEQVPDSTAVEAFETGALAGIGMLDTQVPPRYHTTYFNHVFGSNGYSAGYYSYLWTEVLAVNVRDAFEHKGALNRQTGDEFRSLILSRGYTTNLMNAFQQFTGLQNPDAASFLKYKNLK